MNWDALRARIMNYGMRNSNCVAIAPTATISNIVGVAASIEPEYQNIYVKSNLSGEFTVVNEHLVRAGGLDFIGDPAIGVVVETACVFRRSLSFPEAIDAGLAVTRLGNSSVVYEIALFRQGAEDTPAALGRFAHVWVDRITQRPVRVPARIRAALAPLLVQRASGS